METTQVTISGKTYSIGRLHARKQFHVARRLAPFISGAVKLGPKLKELKVDDALTELIAPLVDTLADMPDAEVDYILDTCLNVCQRQNETGAGWSPVRTSSGSMWADIGMAEELQLAGHVIKANLADFITALRAAGLITEATEGVA